MQSFKDGNTNQTSHHIFSLTAHHDIILPNVSTHYTINGKAFTSNIWFFGLVWPLSHWSDIDRHWLASNCSETG